jgi:hypothetical protein
MEWASFNGQPSFLIKEIIEIGITVKYIAALNSSAHDALFPKKRRLKLLLTASFFYADVGC